VLGKTTMRRLANCRSPVNRLDRLSLASVVPSGKSEPCALITQYRASRRDGLNHHAIPGRPAFLQSLAIDEHEPLPGVDGIHVQFHVELG
jgi:hypothetical protein